MDNTMFQQTLYELMKKYPKEEDFLNMMNTSLRNAAQKLQADQQMKDYADVIVELIKNGRGGEETTLRSFLAYWLALAEHRNWKDMYNDARIDTAIRSLKAQDTTTPATTFSPTHMQSWQAMPMPAWSGTKKDRTLTPEMRQKMLDALKVIEANKAKTDTDVKEKTLTEKLKEKGI